VKCTVLKPQVTEKNKGIKVMYIAHSSQQRSQTASVPCKAHELESLKAVQQL